MKINLPVYISKIIILWLCAPSYSYAQPAFMSNIQSINICPTFNITCIFQNELTLLYLQVTTPPNKQ